MSDLTLYSTWGCHLCEQAEALVQQAGLADKLQVRDIVDDEALFARFRVHIPVLAASDAQGQEQLLYWPFDQSALASWLAALDLTTTD
jgi:hypothetical protein